MRILRIQIREAQKHKAPANPDPDPDRQQWPEKSIHLSVSLLAAVCFAIKSLVGACAQGLSDYYTVDYFYFASDNFGFSRKTSTVYKN